MQVSVKKSSVVFNGENFGNFFSEKVIFVRPWSDSSELCEGLRNKKKLGRWILSEFYNLRSEEAGALEDLFNKNE